MPTHSLLALLLAATGSPPGLEWAVGSWPLENAGRGPPAAFRRRHEQAIEQVLPPAERGCHYYALEDLDGDGRDEVLVFIEAPGACGTAGCPLHVLRWTGRGLAPVSRTSHIRNVFLAPWPRRGWRPLHVEKWGAVLMSVRARRGAYPPIVDERTASAVTEIPEGLREVSWLRAAACQGGRPPRGGTL